MPHIREYILPLQKEIIIEEENVVSHNDREVKYLLRLNIKENRKYIEVAGYEPRNKNKGGINNKPEVKFVELIGMGKEDEKARKEITEELQERYGKLQVFFWTLP